MNRFSLLRLRATVKIHCIFLSQAKRALCERNEFEAKLSASSFKLELKIFSKIYVNDVSMKVIPHCER